MSETTPRSAWDLFGIDGDYLEVGVGDRLQIDGVPCIVTSVTRVGITTRPVTDAD